jgi:hypothetical protein
VSWSKVCLSIYEGGLGIWNLIGLNHVFLGKWLWRYDLRERFGGECSWTLNLAIHGVGGVLLSLLEHLEWGYVRISRKDGKFFLIILDLRWEMDPGLDFGMIGGVEMCYVSRVCDKGVLGIISMSLIK